MRLHELEAFILLDSGCTSDSISPEFAMSANLKAHKLEEPVPLQLGTIGSRSKINFGLFTDFEIGEIKNTHYFNVVNIDRYDAILGTMFMRKHGIVLDFERDEVHIKGKHLDTIIEGPNTFKQAQRHAMLTRLRPPGHAKEKNPDKPGPSSTKVQPPSVRRRNVEMEEIDDVDKHPETFGPHPFGTRRGTPERTEEDDLEEIQAAPMLVVPKKTGKLHTVINAVKRNANTVKDVTPFPDQDLIRLDVAQAKY
ncbi:hypothetical protein L208DRAFT_1316462, partial [Tricholoma matsutake]